MRENLKSAMQSFFDGKRNTDVWVPCTEENYPDGDDCKKCVVKFQDAFGYWDYYIYATCPMGWSTLIKRGAFCKMID